MPERPRILLVGPFPPTTGGVTTFILNLLASPLAREFAFVPFTTSRPPKRDVTENWGYGAIFRGGLGRMVLGILITCWHLLSFPFVVLARRIDLVQVQASDYLVFWEAALYVLMARALRRPVLLRIGGAFDIFHGGSSPFGRRSIAAALRLPDVIIAQSEIARDYLQRAGRHDGILLLPNWVRHIEATTREPTRQPIFLFIAGAEAKRKGVDDVIAAIQQSHRAGVAARFHLAALPASLLRTVKSLGLPNIVAAEGWLTHDRILAAMQQADAFLLPSHGEGFPNSLLEAMSCGLPSVVTAVGGVPEVVRHGGALVIPTGDPVALAAAIARLTDDSALRERLGREARQTVAARFTPDAVLPPLGEAYRRLWRR
jgi:glycosyltransferase involved in cell wall biosynthesis